jgi:RHS repeat-associated protein
MSRTVRRSSVVQSVRNAAHNLLLFRCAIHCQMQPLKSYNRMQMQLASSAAFPEPLLAAMPQLREKPRLGFSSKNPALHQGHEVCNSTTALGLQAALHLERIRSRYTGKERDTESGNDYFGARYFASTMGRWMSPDKPFADQHAGNPQSWNLYSYSLNNPLRFVDDDGREVKETRTTTYYTVSGATANDALGNANKHFSTPDGDHAGMTTANQSWSTSTSWTSTQSNGNITVTTTVTDDTITINQNVQLPQWDGYSQASPDEQKAWDTAVGQLQGHETQHEDINRAGADALDKSLPGTKASATGKELDPTVKASQNNNNAAVQQKVDANQQTTNQNNQHLDACTNHGTQACK